MTARQFLEGDSVTWFSTDGARITWRGDGETLVVEPWGADSVRVRSALSADVVDTGHALLPPPPTAPTATVELDGARARLVNGRLRVELHARETDDVQVGYRVFSCSLAFYDSDGRLLLKERDHGGSLKVRARAFRPITGGGHHLTASFESDPDEKLFGMGMYQEGILDLKGSTFELAHRNAQASIPFVLSSAGYGFFWHNPAIGRATFGRNRTEWVAASTRQLDYWVTAGATPADVVAAFADATGHAPMMPEHGLGYWQCKMRYWNQEQLLEVARRHRREGLPLDVIVADFFHWPRMGDYRFDEEFWPDPAAMVAQLRELGVELMVSVWPQVSVASENFARLRRENLLVRAERGPDVQMSFEGPSMFVDMTHPRARAAVWDLCRRNYHDLGVRVFWLDEAEPEYGVYDFDNYRYHAGPNLEVGNLYPQAFARAFFEGMRDAGQQDVVNLVRCAWAGSQRYGALVWSGDIRSTFEDLRRQVVAGIHLGVAGIPWFTTDIGGFMGGDGADPAFRELLVRWFQFATFCPVMRMHGARGQDQEVRAADGGRRCSTGADNEVWSFGSDVQDVLVRYLRIRERLRPYTRSVMAQAHRAGQPVLRGMFHEFPGDPLAWDVADQFLFGPDLLVAPVVTPSATARRVYLPAGATWTDVWTGEVRPGGEWIEAPAPLGVVPVYARDGSHQGLVDGL